MAKFYVFLAAVNSGLVWLVIIAVPLLVVVLPLVRFLPAVMRWRVRSRIYRWYGELTLLEREVRSREGDLPIERWNAQVSLLTGRAAACFGIAGPGSTNLLTGLYDAKVDRAPVLAISGQVPSKVLGRGAFQDLDLTGAFGDTGLSAFTQRDPEQLSQRRLGAFDVVVSYSRTDSAFVIGFVEAVRARGLTALKSVWERSATMSKASPTWRRLTSTATGGSISRWPPSAGGARATSRS